MTKIEIIIVTLDNRESSGSAIQFSLQTCFHFIANANTKSIDQNDIFAKSPSLNDSPREVVTFSY